ncbi:autotransporter protein YapJ [Xenorhabdus vietnamensis]|uniref:Autotransporter protein YapJ n=1 Tax=Xenorhabdus vietnamensis TaxID=351656 RepID=A0A1Y2SD72_9GAMM|nr:autotransporter outer membrane beta-barrel domain-containing protein [Xenorhabdus vietnamensis]OTA16213.1 autotransporter protein YapJ [Xenorhabdus vietnamensis]
MKIYRHAVFPITLRVALLFQGISVDAIADSSSCSASNTITTISGNETVPCNLSQGENLTIKKNASIDAPIGQANEFDHYGLKYSAVNIGTNNNQAQVISVDSIENNGILQGTTGVTVTYSGSVGKLRNHGTISGTNGTVWVSGHMNMLDNYGSINSSTDTASLNAIQIQPASGSDDNSQYGRIDTILNQQEGSIDGISSVTSTLKLLHNFGTLKSQKNNSLSTLATFVIDAGSNVGTFNNDGTVTGPNHSVLIQNGGYLENLNNHSGSKGFTAEQDAIQVTGQGMAQLDVNPHIRSSKIKQITNASLLYGKRNGIFIDDKGVVDTITNLDRGVIKGDKFAIKNNGTITNDIHNSGAIDGNVELGLGSASLYMSGPNATLKGNVSGTKNSVVTIGGKGATTENLDLTYTHDMNVGTAKILSGSTLHLGDGHKTGSVSNDIDNKGNLYFNRSDKVAYSHVISGTGSVYQVGSGTTTLTGINTYTGSTSVEGGTLVVNGQLGTTTSTFNVKKGGTVDGAGLIGSTTTIENGGHLVGHQGNTLTFGNDLIFNNGANVDISLGAENVSASALFDVKGNLTLAGTFDVTDLGGFSIGEYDIFNYRGTLTDNGTTLLTGGKPGSLSLDTHRKNKVYLINTAGMSLNYWDGGDTSKHNNGEIDGGNGVWQIGGQDNWTLKADKLTGERNSGWSNTDLFAIFSGTAGTVQVDNSGGNVTVNGMQFSTSGYTISGNPLTLKNDPKGSAKIRVGTGKKSATDMVATIESNLTGSATLETTDYGKLVLKGENDYTDGTKITRGVLQIGDGSTKGSISGNIVSGSEGTLIFDRSDNVTFGGNITGEGKLVQNGEGTLVLTGANNYTGMTEVPRGTFRQGKEGALSPTSPYTVGQHGTLDMGGFNATISALSNSGGVLIGGDNKTVGRTLTIAGDYKGNNGTVTLSTVLGGDHSKTDKLVIKGNTSGSTHLVIKNAGGKGAPTNEGIKVVDVKGTSNGTFTLAGDYSYKGEPAIVAGAYAYRLYKNSTDNSDENWYLRSSLASSKPSPEPVPKPTQHYQAGVSVYEAYGQMLQTLNAPESLRDRTGGRKDRVPDIDEFRNPTGEDSTDDSTSQMPNGVWGRMTASYGKLSPRVSTSGADATTYNMVRAQVGMDRRFYENNQGSVTGGIFLQYSNIDANVGSVHGEGHIRANGYTLGTTSTWYGKNKFYLDGLAQITYFDNDLNSKTASQPLGSSRSALGYALSLEAGQGLDLNQAWSLIPQVQLVFSSIDMNEFHDPFGAKIHFDRSESMKFRIGTTIDYRQKWHDDLSHLYGFFNINQEILGRNDLTNVADVAFISGNDRIWGDVGAGGSYSWDNGKSSVYGQASANTSLNNFADSYELKAKVGIKVMW